MEDTNDMGNEWGFHYNHLWNQDGEEGVVKWTVREGGRGSRK